MKDETKPKTGRKGRGSLFVLYENGFFLDIIALPYFVKLVRHAKNVANDNHNCSNSCNRKKYETNRKQIGNKYETNIKKI